MTRGAVIWTTAPRKRAATAWTVSAWADSSKKEDVEAKGVALVSKAGGALREIAGQVEAVNTDIVAIIEASREQSVALSEINRAINTVDQGTQQNAAMVEEQTAASHTLAQEASELFDLLGQFQFGDRPTSTPHVRLASIKSGSPTMPRQIQRAPVAKGRGSAGVAVQSDWEDF